MALVTRCPDCTTTFRITPLHLQAHGGEVRCGHCGRIFNGFAALATMQEPEAEKPVQTKAEETSESQPEIPPGNDSPDLDAQAPSNQQDSSSASGRIPAQAEAPPDEAPDKGPDEIRQEAATSRPSIAEEFPETAGTAEDTSSSSAAPSAAREKSTSKFSDTVSPMAEKYVLENYASENYAFDEAEPSTSSLAASLAWGFASLFLLVVLAAQAAYAYRSEISVMVPAAKPYLERYCELLQCSLPAPQYAKLLNIESSDMQADAKRPGVITLNATVRNHASYSQALPSFQLTLIDTKNQPLASRTFPPDAYLDENSNRERMVAPDDEFNVRLHLDSGDLNAAGYRLLLLYPHS